VKRSSVVGLEHTKRLNISCKLKYKLMVRMLFENGVFDR
jgi:hypothetical protein